MSEDLYRALPTGPHGFQDRMPAEIRYVETQGETGLEQALPLFHFVRLVIYVNSNHSFKSNIESLISKF
jgi:hypothetical protein